MISSDQKMINQLGKGYFPESIPVFMVRRDRKGHELTRGDVYHKLRTNTNDANNDPFKPSEVRPSSVFVTQALLTKPL